MLRGSAHRVEPHRPVDWVSKGHDRTSASAAALSSYYFMKLSSAGKQLGMNGVQATRHLVATCHMAALPIGCDARVRALRHATSRPRHSPPRIKRKRYHLEREVERPTIARLSSILLRATVFCVVIS
jgi:hypothetical protein